MFTIEVGSPPSSESRFQRMSTHFKIFKWFITINVLLLLIFCGYALWSLYQLESALRSREGYLFDKYENIGSSSVKVNVAELNDSVVISDFNEWRRSIIKSLENLQQEQEGKANASYNLQFLLHTITSIVENFVDPNKNSVPLGRSKLVITNLTDFEIHILKEFTRLKTLENNGDVKSRIVRTTKNVKDESQCNLQFSFTTANTNDSKAPGRVIVKPTKNNEGTYKIKNTVDEREKSKSDVRECSFNIIYEPK